MKLSHLHVSWRTDASEIFPVDVETATQILVFTCKYTQRNKHHVCVLGFGEIKCHKVINDRNRREMQEESEEEEKME